MTSDRPLILRCDASVSMGTGHVMRCLALAQAWQDAGGTAVFAMTQSTPAIEQRLRSEAVRIDSLREVPGSVEDAQASIGVARACSAKWIVVDGYQFDADYQRRLKEAGLKVLFVDDFGHAEYYPADLVLNQNAHASERMYTHRADGTRLLLGPRYALLRSEFSQYQTWMRDIPTHGSRLLLTMGGSDPDNFTPRILPFLADLPNDNLRIRVVMGGSAAGTDVVAELAERTSGHVEPLRDVCNMAAQMAWADLAISAAGTTCWEMCFLGLPAILLIVADNQELIAERLAEAGAAENAGYSKQVDCAVLSARAGRLLASREHRIAMSDRGKRLVDGRGRDRVIEIMRCGDEVCA